MNERHRTRTLSNNKVCNLISHFEELCILRARQNGHSRRLFRQNSNSSACTDVWASQDSQLDRWSQCGDNTEEYVLQPATSIEAFEQRVYFDKGERNEISSDSDDGVDIIGSKELTHEQKSVEEIRRRAKEEEQKYRKSFYESDDTDEINRDEDGTQIDEKKITDRITSELQVARVLPSVTYNFNQGTHLSGKQDEILLGISGRSHAMGVQMQNENKTEQGLICKIIKTPIVVKTTLKSINVNCMQSVISDGKYEEQNLLSEASDDFKLNLKLNNMEEHSELIFLEDKAIPQKRKISQSSFKSNQSSQAEQESDSENSTKHFEAAALSVGNNLEPKVVYNKALINTVPREFTEQIEFTSDMEDNIIAGSPTKNLESSETPISTQNVEVIATSTQAIKSSQLPPIQLQSEHDMPTKKDKKMYIVNELIESEKNYLQNLNVVTRSYMMPMLKYKCSRTDVETIFTNMKDIFEKSQMFLIDLQECNYNYTEIGKVFCRHRDLFEKYPKYCRNRRMAYLLITKKYKDIILNQGEKINDKLGLNSSLLKPVQRLAKYELLLINLNKTLINEGHEIQSIKNAIALIQNIARISDAMVILETIKRNPHNYRSMGAFLLKDNFKLLQPEKSDVVVFLFKKMVIFTEELPNHPDVYFYKTFVPMALLRYNSSYNNLTFALEYFNKKKILSYVLEAKDEKCKTTWTSEINKILWRQLEKYKIEAELTQQSKDNASRELSEARNESLINLQYSTTSKSKTLKVDEVNNNVKVEAPPILKPATNGYLTEDGYEILADAKASGTETKCDERDYSSKVSAVNGDTRHKKKHLVPKRTVRQDHRNKKKKAVTPNMSVIWAMGR